MDWIRYYKCTIGVCFGRSILPRRRVHCSVGLFLVAVTLILADSTIALTTSVHYEAEVGSWGGNATSIADMTASGNQAVLFTVSSGSTDPCASFPAQPTIQPTVVNTGVPAGTTLTPSGDITVTSPGTVIDAMNVAGTITIEADNVTIRNSKIRMNPGNYYAVRIKSGTGTQILHSEIYAVGGAYTGVSADGGNVVLCGSHIYGFENPVTIWRNADNSFVQANFIEKLHSETPATAHPDGIELYGSNNHKVYGNTILMTDQNGDWLSVTGAINVSPDSPMSNVEIVHNWIGGGSYTLNTDNRYGSISGLKVINNVWYGSPPFGHAQYGPIRDGSVISEFTGNTWEDGSALSL